MNSVEWTFPKRSFSIINKEVMRKPLNTKKRSTPNFPIKPMTGLFHWLGYPPRNLNCSM